MEIEDYQDNWVGEKRLLFLAYALDIPTSLTPTEWVVNMYPDDWLVTVTLLWNIFWLNVETAEVRQKYYDADSLQQLFQETSVTYVFDLLHEVGLFYRI